MISINCGGNFAIVTIEVFILALYGNLILMNITIVAVGRMKTGAECDIWNTYKRRIRWDLKLHEIQTRTHKGNQYSSNDEAELLTKIKPKNVVLVALDRTGTSMSSEEFANQLNKWSFEDKKDIAFFIGGADGLKKTFLHKTNLILSLGKQTWPHMLARCMLIEQIYRAQCILSNHPYHH